MDIMKKTLNLSLSFIGDYNDETNFPHKLLLTHTQVSSSDMKLSKAQLSETAQLRGIFR